MCGIAGWIGALPEPQVHADRLARALRHRGPDGTRSKLWDHAGLVHTRLSIIDPSPAGAQPMSNEDGSVWTVVNGEIYNHAELRVWLEGRGHVFTSRCDAEVLPHLYEEEGSRCVERLRGMFALAVLDLRLQRLVLARDRFGIKPLYYTTCESGRTERLGFASELHALRQLPDVDGQPDPQALVDFVALGYIPGPQTFYRGLQALAPAELLEARWDGQSIHQAIAPFHRFVVAPDFGLTDAHAVSEAERRLDIAVARQVESDVPLGALLSGGIDSSLVSSAARKQLPELQTFNVQFSDDGYDETWAATAVGDHIGSEHTVLRMDDTPGTWEQVTNSLRHAGQPFADTSLFATHAVCRLMRQRVTVALSGDGGDEVFGGYNLFWQTARASQFQALPPSMGRAASVALRVAARTGAIRPTLALTVHDMAGADDAGVVQQLLTWSRPEEQRQLSRDHGVEPVARHFERQWAHELGARPSRVERVSALATEVSTRLVLANAYLPKVDMASMAEGLEVRVPMLDEELFDFGLTLPHRLKVRGREAKVVLREVARRRLPVSIATKPKRGFGVPVDAWVDADFKRRLRDTLLGPSSVLWDYLPPPTYRPVITAFCDDVPLAGISRVGLYQKAIMMLALHEALTEPASRSSGH